MTGQPRRNLSSAPPASDEPSAPADAALSTHDLLERVERLSGQLALVTAQLKTVEERAAAYTKERAARRKLSLEVRRLRAVERERDELVAANEELRQHLEGMWFQLRSSEARVSEAHSEGAKGLLGRLGHHR